jgi:hypothetical protein
MIALRLGYFLPKICFRLLPLFASIPKSKKRYILSEKEGVYSSTFTYKLIFREHKYVVFSVAGLWVLAMALIYQLLNWQSSDYLKEIHGISPSKNDEFFYSLF